MSLPVAPSNTYPIGQCTWWAAERFHQLTGLYIPWKANAADWATLATQAGYFVSSTPRVGDIVCMQPGVQGAGSPYGHVAIVEGVNADGSVNASNQNWAGVTYPDTINTHLTPGSGISFISATKNSGSMVAGSGTAGDITTGASSTDQTSAPASSSGIATGNSVADAVLNAVAPSIQSGIHNVLPIVLLVAIAITLLVVAVLLIKGNMGSLPIKKIAELAL